MQHKKVFTTVLACGLFFVYAEQSQAQPAEPANGGVNIVILFADDLGYGDLSSYGHPSIETPRLDQLAAEGQRWTNFYAAAAVCSPSRGALMTGNYSVRSGLYGRRRLVLFPDEEGAIPSEQQTLPEALREAGYSTAMFGKWHLGDQPEGLPTRHGFDQWYGIPYSNDMDWLVGPTSPEIFAAAGRGETDFVVEAIADRKIYSLAPQREYWNIPLIHSVKTIDGYRDTELARSPDQSRLTADYTSRAVDFIAEQSETDQPFFLYVAYTMPHVPLFPGAEFSNTSAAGRYGDVVEEIDWSAGQIADALARYGLAENTLLVFSSDNGPWLTMDQHSGTAGPLRHGKQTTFEGGMRVPGIFWWPGTIAPALVSDIGTVMDLYATALALAGTGPNPQAVDSIDLSPVLAGAASPRNDFAYYRGGELYAWRQGQYKLHFITQGAYGLPPQRTEHPQPQLYHLGDDPGERFDIGAEQPEVVAEILAAVQRHREALTVAEPVFDLGRE